MKNDLVKETLDLCIRNSLGCCCFEELRDWAAPMYMLSHLKEPTAKINFSLLSRNDMLVMNKNAILKLNCTHNTHTKITKF